MSDEIAGHPRSGDHAAAARARRKASIGMTSNRRLPSVAENAGSSARRRGAKTVMKTASGLPLAADTEIAGHESREHQRAAARVRRKAVVDLAASRGVPSVAITESPGLPRDENHRQPARARRGAVLDVATNATLPLDALIAELVQLQRQRVFCIKSQSRCDRSVESFIARFLGYRGDASEADRKALWKTAAALRRAVETGGEGQHHNDDQKAIALAACAPIILLSAQSRAGWDNHLDQVVARMCAIAEQLPAWSFIEGVRGLGALGFAVIIGETGNLSNYATKERVWKRLGLAVMDGLRQGRVEPGLSREDRAARFTAHGYSPARRAQVWSFVSDVMFRHQWRGEKDGGPAHPIGPYGEVYAKRKAHTEGREWPPAHRDADARRVMTKTLIEDLWRAWRADTSTNPGVAECPQQ